MNTFEVGNRFRTDIPDSVKPKYMTLIHPKSGRYVKGVGEKNALLASLDPEEAVLLAWTGEWSTDIFILRVKTAIERMN